MLPLFDRDGSFDAVLRDALDRGALLLTANSRAARALLASYADDQRALGLHAWPAPRILDWGSWAAELWEQHTHHTSDAPLVLTRLQEQRLWRRAQGEDRYRVVAPERMAALAAEAWSLLSSYSAQHLRQRAEAHEDAARFLAWAESFERLCGRNGWMAMADTEATLAAHAESLRFSQEILLIGFDRVLPAQQLLLDAAARQGTTLVPYSLPARSGRPTLVHAKSEAEELQACAAWCRTQLRVGSGRQVGSVPQVGSGGRRIAILTPQPEEIRDGLDRTLRRVLAPGDRLFEFSLGTPLSSQPLVRSALLLLRLCSAPLATRELTQLLTSGVLAAGADDELALAQADSALRARRQGDGRWTLRHLAGRRELPARAQKRLSELDRLRQRCGLDAASSWSGWAELVPELLNAAGWPGWRTLDAINFQVQRRWERLLGELAELDFDGSRPSWAEFLEALSSEAAQTTFSPESKGAPIQIMGIFESSGQQFDAVWLLGADEERWPAVGRPHPLLPLALQREAGMPHSTPQADAELGKDATERVLRSAPEVVVSYAHQRGASELRVSPLAPTGAACTAETAASLTARLAPPAAPPQATLETLIDDSGTISWPAQQVAGGTEVLKRQSACAMQSFAMQRLQARALEDPEDGLDARERGTLIHAVLQSLWAGANAPTQPALASHADLERVSAANELAPMVSAHIAAAFADEVRAAANDPWRLAYLEVEQQRVRQRVLAWLDCELARTPFTVAEVEASAARTLAVAALTLRGRPDRVDVLQDGSHLLLDYKTGKTDAKDWDGDRPREPQLPLYALHSGIDNVSGIAFAQIRAAGTALVPRAEASLTTNGKLTDKNRLDDEVRDNWRDALGALANDFLEGQAALDPREAAKTCRWCPLAGLCRVHAEGLLDDEDDDAAEATVE